MGWYFRMVLKCNEILKIHASWLFENEYYDEYRDCLKQISLTKEKDPRQTEGYSKRRRMKNEVEQTI